MATIKELKDILTNELHRITNPSTQLSAEEQAAELRRNHAVNATAGNIIKIAALSVQVANLKQKHLQEGGSTPYYLDEI